MSIEEKSKVYANGKALDAITTAIEQAYIDGYNDGLKHLENERLEAIKEGVEYKDLGLSSGKLWSSHYRVDVFGDKELLPYIEASKLNIPTKEDFEELLRECHVDYYYSPRSIPSIKFTGRTGEEIFIESIDFMPLCQKKNYGDFIFWLNDKNDNDEKITASIKFLEGKHTPQYNKVFMGLRLPIMLVKEK